MGRTFFRLDNLLVVHDTVFRGVDGDFLRFCQRTDPLVVIELFRGRVILFVQKRELRVEEESLLLSHPLPS